MESSDSSGADLQEPVIQILGRLVPATRQSAYCTTSFPDTRETAYCTTGSGNTLLQRNNNRSRADLPEQIFQ